MSSITESFESALDSFVLTNGHGCSVTGEPLTSGEMTNLERALDYFHATWKDSPVTGYLNDRWARVPVGNRIRFVVVAFVAQHTATPEAKALNEQYSFASRRLHIERTREADHSSTPFRHAGFTSVDVATRDLLARARVAMRVRTLDYLVDGGAGGLPPHLVMSPSNALVGYVV